MCGIAGIHSQNNVASDLFDCLVHLQHRGQDAAGIMTYDDTHMHKAKGMGLARDVFNEKKMSELQGKVGVAHNRYPTHGGFGHGEIQPFWTNVPYGIALAHNGNITNYSDLVNLISEKDKRYLNTSSDTEVLMNLFADQLHSAKKVNSEEEFFNLLCKSIEYIYENVKGSYSIVGMIVGKGLIAFRDPQGIRPLVYGKRTSKKGSDYIFASENSMFYSLEFEPKGNVLPGELYYISESGKKFKRRIKKVSFNPCVFEYVYFSRPDSNLNDVSVYRSRLRMGQNLARSWKNKFPDIEPDIIIPAPSTANTAALSFAHELGVRYSEGLFKNPFIGRTFIMPEQKERRKSLKYKLVPQETEIRGKKVLILDDSIVRGNTSREIVRMLRDFGAKKVYFAVSCPPIKFPCYYGVDMPTREELIANNKSIDEIKKFLEVDEILYQDIDQLIEAVTRKGDHHIDRPCMACLDGNYVAKDIDDKKILELELSRKNDRNGN